MAAPVVVAKNVIRQAPCVLRVQGDGVNVPVTPVTVKVTVPVGVDAPAPAVSLTNTLQV